MLTANMAAAGPVLVVVDDAHWADGPSLRWLAYLAPRMEGLAASEREADCVGIAGVGAGSRPA